MLQEVPTSALPHSLQRVLADFSPLVFSKTRFVFPLGPAISSSLLYIPRRRRAAAALHCVLLGVRSDSHACCVRTSLGETHFSQDTSLVWEKIKLFFLFHEETVSGFPHLLQVCPEFHLPKKQIFISLCLYKHSYVFELTQDWLQLTKIIGIPMILELCEQQETFVPHSCCGGAAVLASTQQGCRKIRWPSVNSWATAQWISQANSYTAFETPVSVPLMVEQWWRKSCMDTLHPTPSFMERMATAVAILLCVCVNNLSCVSGEISHRFQ